MAERDDSGFKTYKADAAITIYSRVKRTATGIDTAGLAERCIGTLQTKAANAAGDYVPVKLYTAPGTHRVRVKEANSINAILYTEAGGEVQDTDQATAFVWGIALDAATAEDDIIEALPFIQPDIAST